MNANKQYFFMALYITMLKVVQTESLWMIRILAPGTPYQFIPLSCSILKSVIIQFTLYSRTSLY